MNTPGLEPRLADAGEDQASDEALRELCLSSEPILQGGFLNVHRDAVRLPDGKLATREYVMHAGAVMIVALLDDAHVVMERQFRYPLGRVMLEMPAGKIDPFEAPLVCAQRELREETGYTASEWARAGVLHNAMAYSNESIEIWFARGLALGERHLDEGEFLEVVRVSDASLSRAVRDGQVTDAKTMIASMYLEKVRSGAWPLAWQAVQGGVARAIEAR